MPATARTPVTAGTPRTAATKFEHGEHFKSDPFNTRQKIEDDQNVNTVKKIVPIINSFALLKMKI